MQKIFKFLLSEPINNKTNYVVDFSFSLPASVYYTNPILKFKIRSLVLPNAQKTPSVNSSPTPPLVLRPFSDDNTLTFGAMPSLWMPCLFHWPIKNNVGLMILSTLSTVIDDSHLCSKTCKLDYLVTLICLKVWKMIDNGFLCVIPTIDWLHVQAVPHFSPSVSLTPDHQF